LIENLAKLKVIRYLTKRNNLREKREIAFEMEDVIIKASPHTPRVEFCFSEGQFLIQGIIDPGDPKHFFDPLLNKLKGYLLEDVEESQLIIAPTFVRASSVPFLNRLLKAFLELSKHGQKVSILWQCRGEDESLIALADQLSKMSSLSMRKEII